MKVRVSRGALTKATRSAEWSGVEMVVDERTIDIPDHNILSLHLHNDARAVEYALLLARSVVLRGAVDTDQDTRRMRH